MDPVLIQVRNHLGRSDEPIEITERVKRQRATELNIMENSKILLKTPDIKQESISNPYEIDDEFKDTAERSALLRLAARRLSNPDTRTPAELTRLLNQTDMEVDRRLGMIKESIDTNVDRLPYNMVSNTEGGGLGQMIDTEQRMASRTAELEFRRNTFWKSCCDSVIDRRATVFFTQVGIGAIVIMFAMSKLWLAEPHRCSGDDPSVYIGLISVILGWFVPAPSMK